MKKIIYILSCAFLLISCDSFLDEEPNGLIDPMRFYATEADGVAALAGIYHHLMHNDAFGSAIDDYLGLTHDLTTPSRVLGGRVFFAYRWDENTPEVRDIWKRLYMAVNDANILIARIPESALPQETKDELVAEAVFLRAFTYHYLTVIFGDVPYVTEPTMDAEGFAANAGMERTPVEQIRQSLIADLVSVEDLLPAVARTDYPARATRWAAKTLKLKIYLWLKDYANAVAAAQDIVDHSDRHLLPVYADIFRPDNEFNEEVIFQLDYIFNEFPTNRHSRFQPRAQDENASGGPLPSYFDGFNNYTVFRSFADTYAATDLRRSSNTYEVLENGTPLHFTYIIKQWRIEDARGNSGLNYRFYRFADVLLSLAEAENELNGPTPAAYEAINRVRARAGLEPLEGLSRETLGEAIRRERAWELLGEGTYRKLDLLRWGEMEKSLRERIELEKVQPDGHPNQVNNLEVTLQYYSPHKNVLPVPAAEITLNPNLIQNEGYN